MNLVSPHVISLTGQSEADFGGDQSEALNDVRGFGVGGDGVLRRQSTLLLTGESLEISCFSRSGVFFDLKYSIHSSRVRDNCSKTSKDRAGGAPLFEANLAL